MGTARTIGEILFVAGLFIFLLLIAYTWEWSPFFVSIVLMGVGLALIFFGDKAIDG